MGGPCEFLLLNLSFRLDLSHSVDSWTGTTGQDLNDSTEIEPEKKLGIREKELDQASLSVSKRAPHLRFGEGETRGRRGARRFRGRGNAISAFDFSWNYQRFFSQSCLISVVYSGLLEKSRCFPKINQHSTFLFSFSTIASHFTSLIFFLLRKIYFRSLFQVIVESGFRKGLLLWSDYSRARSSLWAAVQGKVQG